jgi:hypothetical protein
MRSSCQQEEGDRAGAPKSSGTSGSPRRKRVEVGACDRPDLEEPARLNEALEGLQGESPDVRPNDLDRGRLVSKREKDSVVERREVGNPDAKEPIGAKCPLYLTNSPKDLLDVFEDLVGDHVIERGVAERERFALNIYYLDGDAGCTRLFNRGLVDINPVQNALARSK